ncbi:MAG: site-2 protease family protein [Asgard group archaeon]|nr:site-2 protease family protein [Asgard group archaeon]
MPLEDANDTSSDDIQFCWHCGADIRYQTQSDICDNCQAPLKESTRKQIFKRTSPVQSIKCWRCGGTTSGDVCGICGSPLTMDGVGALRKKEEVTLEITDRVAVYSPKDRQFVPIEMTFDELKVTLEKYVELIDAQNTEAGPLFIVRRPENSKVTFAQLRKESLFKEKYLKTLIRNEKINPEIQEITIRFFYWKPDTIKEQFKFKKIGWNIGLYLATIITVSLAGWMFIRDNYTTYDFRGNLGLDIFLFTFSLLAILTVHEFGHYSVSRLKKLDASLPYFIPIPPIIPGTLGTFGALIRQKEPFVTRDDLFEIGIAGPIGGFITTIPIFLIGLRLTYIVDIVPLDPVPLADIPTVLLADGLQYLGFATGIVPYYDPTMQMAVMHPMLFAGWIGFILTGINLVPASQLDGGHTTRAVFGGMAHRIVSLVFAGLMILNKFTRYMGLFILIFSFQPHPGATDDVSKVHWSKNIFLVLSWIVGIVCLPLPIGQIQSLLQ